MEGVQMTDEAYYEYLNSIYQEVTQWLNKKDHVADSTKREFFCKMRATPYYYWKKEELPKEDKSFDKVGLLNALKKKYSLSPTKDGLKLPGYLGREEFKHLADNMRLCGYHYDSEEKEFRLEVPVHV
jgi:hypothetical protein